MARVVALLDSMWGWRGYVEKGEEAPKYFRINRDNYSGRRLYNLVGGNQLLVTNSCRVVQGHANSHGKPDATWVRENLVYLAEQGIDLLLVCGTVARATYAAAKLKPIGYAVLHMDHPAARRWTRDGMEETRRRIARICARRSEKEATK